MTIGIQVGCGAAVNSKLYTLNSKLFNCELLIYHCTYREILTRSQRLYSLKLKPEIRRFTKESIKIVNITRLEPMHQVQKAWISNISR